MLDQQDKDCFDETEPHSHSQSKSKIGGVVVNNRRFVEKMQEYRCTGGHSTFSYLDKEQEDDFKSIEESVTLLYEKRREYILKLEIKDKTDSERKQILKEKAINDASGELFKGSEDADELLLEVNLCLNDQKGWHEFILNIQKTEKLSKLKNKLFAFEGLCQEANYILNASFADDAIAKGRMFILMMKSFGDGLKQYNKEKNNFGIVGFDDWCDINIRQIKKSSRSKYIKLASRKDCHPYTDLGVDRLVKLVSITENKSNIDVFKEIDSLKNDVNNDYIPATAGNNQAKEYIPVSSIIKYAGISTENIGEYNDDTKKTLFELDMLSLTFFIFKNVIKDKDISGHIKSKKINKDILLLDFELFMKLVYEVFETETHPEDGDEESLSEKTNSLRNKKKKGAFASNVVSLIKKHVLDTVHDNQEVNKKDLLDLIKKNKDSILVKGGGSKGDGDQGSGTQTVFGVPDNFDAENKDLILGYMNEIEKLLITIDSSSPDRIKTDRLLKSKASSLNTLLGTFV